AFGRRVLHSFLHDALPILRVWCDLNDSEQIQAMVRQVAEHFGHIDILVNNARAIIGRDKVPVTELREDVWQHFLAINTTAVFLRSEEHTSELQSRSDLVCR